MFLVTTTTIQPLLCVKTLAHSKPFSVQSIQDAFADYSKYYQLSPPFSVKKNWGIQATQLVRKSRLKSRWQSLEPMYLATTLQRDANEFHTYCSKYKIEFIHCGYTGPLLLRQKMGTNVIVLSPATEHPWRLGEMAQRANTLPRLITWPEFDPWVPTRRFPHAVCPLTSNCVL